MQQLFIRCSALFCSIFIGLLLSFCYASSFGKKLFPEFYAVSVLACDVPLGITISTITKTNATVSWSAVANALEYQIRFRETGTGSWNNNTTSLAGKTLTGLIPFTDYEVQVQSVCDVSQTIVSGFSPSVYFTTEADTVLLRGAYLQMVTPNSITVRWKTNIAVDSKVCFGTSLACEQIVFDTTLVNEHILTLAGLQPDTKYFYSIGTTAEVLQGDTANYFVTALVKGSNDHFRTWVCGDHGKSSVAQTAVRDAFINYNGNVPVNVWLWLGDNAYENGTDAEFQKNVFDKYPEQFKNIPLYPSPGNHDYGNVGYTGEQALGYDFTYYSIFLTPANGEAGGVPSASHKYYSFDYANVHFVSLDTYGAHNFPGSEMYQWLDEDLTQNKQRWTVIYFHHPPYTMISHNSNNEIESIDIRKNLIPLFDKHHVDLVLSGHAHGNERSYLIKGNTGRSETFNAGMLMSNEKNKFIKRPPFKGTVYAVCGSSAQNIGTAQSEFPLRCMAYSDTINNCSMIIDVHNDTLDAKYLSSEGDVTDNFIMIKSDVPYLPDTNKLFCTLTRQALEVSYLKQNDEKPSIRLINAEGKVISVFDNAPSFLKNNYATYEFPVHNKNISDGVYFLTIDENGNSKSCRVIYAR